VPEDQHELGPACLPRRAGGRGSDPADSARRSLHDDCSSGRPSRAHRCAPVPGPARLHLLLSERAAGQVREGAGHAAAPGRRGHQRARAAWRAAVPHRRPRPARGAVPAPGGPGVAGCHPRLPARHDRSARHRRRGFNCPDLQRQMGESDTLPPPAQAARSCAETLGARRNFFTTADTVADLDSLREALHVRSWTLDGASYGTFTAEQYALAHPGRVRRLVLDSVVRAGRRTGPVHPAAMGQGGSRADPPRTQLHSARAAAAAEAFLLAPGEQATSAQAGRGSLARRSWRAWATRPGPRRLDG
jgi:alpha/beta hydrolase fold